MKRNNSVYKAFKDIAQTNGNKTAVIYLGERFSYNKLMMLSERMASFFTSAGVRKGDRFVLYTPNCPQWVISWLGLQKIGALAVPVSPIYTAHDLGYIVTDSGARGILCTDTNFGYVKKIAQQCNLDKIIVTNLADLLPWWKRLTGKAFDRIPEGKVGEEKITPFRKCLESPPERGEEDCGDGSDILEILYTGGTTKFPKGVPIHHDIFIESFLSQLRVSSPLVPLEDNIIVQGAPLFHVLGQVFSLGPICLTGGTVILMPKVNLDAVMLYIQRYKAKTLFGVPPLYRMILEHDRINYYDLSSLRYCFTGGDVLPVEVLRRWKEQFGIRIYQGYGATETCGGVTMVPVDGDPPEETIGKILPEKKVKIVEPETLKEVPIGHTGELIVTSDPMIRGYWNKKEETMECFVEMEGVLWYRTGDLVRLGENGYMYFVDRTADIIKHKGYRVSASEIEGVLKDHPAIIAACVVGVPDKKVGERIKAFVVLKEDIKGITGKELIKWCKSKLTSYKVPEYIEFRDMLPKSKVGKYLRRELRKEERKRSTV